MSDREGPRMKGRKNEPEVSRRETKVGEIKEYDTPRECLEL